MQRLPLTNLMLVLATIGLVFGWYVNQVEPTIEVMIDNTAVPTTDSLLFPVEQPVSQFSDFDAATILEAVPETVTDEDLDYSKPFEDEELGITWDGEKVHGWDDEAPTYDGTNLEPTQDSPGEYEIYFAPFVGYDQFPPGTIIDPNNPGCPDMIAD